MATRIPYSPDTFSCGEAGPDDDQIFRADFQGWGSPSVPQPVFNGRPNPPQPLKVTGAPGSTADPGTDGNRKAVGRTSTGIVFGN